MNTAAELFADDIMKIVMARLSVRLFASSNNAIDVLLVDNKTGHGFRCTGQTMFISPLPTTFQLTGGEPDVGQPSQLSLLG